MLKLENLYCGYRKDFPILQSIDLMVNVGETLAVFGQNGSGKSTLVKAIVNSLPYRTGNIWFNNTNITNCLTWQIICSGMSVFTQGGRTFPQLTVMENIYFAGRTLNKVQLNERLKELKEYFDLLNEKSRLRLLSSNLSGGEKSQLAMVMALITKPLLLILDEPSAGLSPKNVNELFKVIKNVNEVENVTLVLIEQNKKEALKFCDSYIIIENGCIKR